MITRLRDQRGRWLEECADHLISTRWSRGPVDMVNLVQELGIELSFTPAAENERGTGVAELLSNGAWRIKVKGVSKNHRYLNPRDRFTIAHELGHILLFKKFKLAPTSKSDNDYQACEQLCHDFAGRILIPSEYLRDIVADSPRSLYQQLSLKSKLLNVSFAAIAHRVSTFVPNIALFFGCEAKNQAQQDVFRVLWCAHSISGLQLSSYLHIFPTDAIGSIVFGVLRSSNLKKTPRDVESADVAAHIRFSGPRYVLVTMTKVKKDTIR